MDKELTFYPETERTRDLIYSEYSSCDRSIHLLIQESPGVPYDLLLKGYRETISAYLSSADLLPPADFLEQLVQRFDRLCGESGVPVDQWKTVGIHLVLRCVDAAYVLTTHERDVFLCTQGRMLPLVGAQTDGVERVRLASCELQAELFPQTLGDIVMVFKIGPAQLGSRDLVLGCAEGETETVLEGLCGPVWLDSGNKGDMRAARHSIVSKFVSHRVLVVRFGDIAGDRGGVSAVTSARSGRARRWGLGRRSLSVAIASVLVTILIAVLWRREGADPERAASAHVSRPGVSVRERTDAATPSEGRLGRSGDEQESIRLNEEWRQRYENEVTSSPVLFEEMVVFGCRDGGVYALRRDTGTQLWKFVATAGVGSSPVVWRDRVIVADYNGNVFGLDGRTGERIWTRKLPMKVVSSPDVSGSRVIMGCLDGRVYCLSTDDGSVLWTARTGGRIRGFAAASEETFFIPSYDGFLYALSTATGEVVWRSRLGGAVTASPAIAGGLVVVGGSDGKVHCIDAVEGTTKWTFPTGAAVESRACIADGSVFIGSNDGHLYRLDLAEGTMVWRIKTGRVVLGRPWVRNGVVYAGSYDGRLYAIDVSAGSLLDAFEAGGPVYSSPTVDENHVYFGTNRGEFICVRYRGGGAT